MRGSNKKNVVMIADDDLFVRKIIRSALEGLAEIIEVTNGSDVEAAYAKHHPDILFLDIHLPNKSGMDLIHPIIRTDKGAYIIMLTADSSEDNVRHSRMRGSRGFMTKPFTKQRIMHYFQNCPTIQYSD